MGQFEPDFDPDTNTVTIPNNPYVTYHVNGDRVKGSVVIEEETTVVLKPKPPTRLRDGATTSWVFSPNTAVQPQGLPVEVVETHNDLETD